jgi:hypothetical protein
MCFGSPSFVGIMVVLAAWRFFFGVVLYVPILVM